MLLVVISLVIGTILTTAYLVSRDNSVAIAQNIAAAAAARSAAVSGLDLGLAIMQTETGWRTDHTAGLLLDDFSLAGASVDLSVRDLETGNPPVADSRYFQMTARATVNGVEQAATAVDYAPPPPAGYPFAGHDDVVDVDLSEFALFARGNINLWGWATVTRWPVAPLAVLGRRIAIGTRSTNGGSVYIAANAAALDTTVYRKTGAPGVLNNQSAQPVDQVALDDVPPLPDAPDHGPLPPPSGSLNLVNTTYTLASDYQADGGSEDDIRLDGAQLILVGDITVATDQDFLLYNSSTVVVDGNVTIIVRDDLRLNNESAIELRPGATLRVFVAEALTVSNSYIGDERPDNTRDNTGYAPYMDLRRLQLFTIDSHGDDWTWRFSGTSVVKANIYGPTARLTIQNNSALYGRAAVDRIVVTDNGAVFYDHGLDGRWGYTNPDSKLFDPPTQIKPAFLGLSSLDPAQLTSVADAEGLVVRAGGSTHGVGPAGPPPPPGSPTPRPVPVEHDLVTVGPDMGEWERR